MGMHLTEHTVGLWCVQVGDRSNWLCHLGHEKGKFVLDYSFRFHDKTRDTCEERCSYHGELRSARDIEDAVDRIRKLYHVVLDRTRDKRGWEVLRDEMRLESSASPRSNPQLGAGQILKLSGSRSHSPGPIARSE